MMMWKPATSYTLNVASLGTRWLAFGVLFDQTRQLEAVAYPGIFFGGGVQQIQLRTEGRQNEDLGAVAP